MEQLISNYGLINQHHPEGLSAIPSTNEFVCIRKDHLSFYHLLLGIFVRKYLQVIISNDW
jgi:hypothetical protein